MQNSQTKKISSRTLRLVIIGVSIVTVIGLLYAFAQRNAENSVLDETVLIE